MDRISLRIFGLAALLWLTVAASNVGFIAIDDYMHGIVLYVPAQYSSAAKIIEASQFRSPLPNLFLLGVSKLALRLGLEDPLAQLRFVTVTVTLLGLVGLYFAIRHFRLLHHAGAPESSARLQKLMALVGGFYFLNPLFMSRPLIESLSVPFLTASSYFLLRAYHNRSPFLSSLLSILLLSLACVFRYQVGLWALAYVALLWSPSCKKTLPALALGGILGFALTGLPDLFLKGSFHSSLKSYLAYNLESSSIYGTSPFYTYGLLLMGLSLPPTFLTRFPSMAWKKYLDDWRPLLWGLGAFVVGHSAVPHKEERFMVPILLLFWVLLVPLLEALKSRRQWRWKYFVAVNALLILPCSFNPPQINTIRLVKWMEREHADDQLYTLAEGNFLFPRAFSARQDLRVSTRSLAEIRNLNLDCHDLVAVRYDVKQGFAEALPQLEEIFVSEPGPLEKIVVRLNPAKNARRGPLSVFRRRGCPET